MDIRATPEPGELEAVAVLQLELRNYTYPAFGLYRVRFSVDGRKLVSLPLRIVQRRPES